MSDPGPWCERPLRHEVFVGHRQALLDAPEISMPGGAVEGGAANAVAGGVRRRLAGEYGAAEFITKPVDFDLLKTQLRDLSDAAD
jgi:hypothetical protein